MSDEVVVTEEEKKERKPMNPTLKKVLLQICGFLVSILPLCILVGIRWDVYTATKSSSLSLGFGGIMAVGLMLVNAIGKMPKKIHPALRLGVALLLAVAFRSLLSDIIYLLAATLVGELLYLFIFEWQIKRLQREIDQKPSLDAMDKQTQAIVEAINNQNKNKTVR